MTTLLTPAVVVHSTAAIAALAVGSAMFLGRKGDARHRLIGRVWMTLMVTVALSSFLIRAHGDFSWLHLLSLVTLAMVGRAVWAARVRNVVAHRATVIGLYVGGLVAGAFALLPQRLLGHALWSVLGMI